MSLKKLATLLAVSVFALTACGSKSDDKSKESGDSAKELIEQAKEESGDAMPEYGITFYGTWTTEGYEIEGGEITGSAVTSKEEYYIYLVKDGKILQKISTGGEGSDSLPDFSFKVEAPKEGKDEYVVGISGKDLGDIGAEIKPEDLYRYEKILVLPAAEEAAEE